MLVYFISRLFSKEISAENVHNAKLAQLGKSIFFSLICLCPGCSWNVCNRSESKKSLPRRRLPMGRRRRPDGWEIFIEVDIYGQSGYRRYLYHQSNVQTTGSALRAAARPWLILKSAPPTIPYDTPVTGMDMEAIFERICNAPEQANHTVVPCAQCTPYEA